MWLFFSIAAVALPAVGLCIKLRAKHRLWPLSLGSFLFYSLVCMDELFTLRRRCLNGDYGGIEDTIGAVIFICGGLAIVVLALNAVLLAVSRERE